MSRLRINVIGGGAIGLACAWRLARSGARVIVFDAAREAREASWAAGGMLAPHHECDADGPLWRLGAASLARWPAFARSLGGAAGLDYHRRGGWMPARGADEFAICTARASFLATHGVPHRWHDRRTLSRAEPALRGAEGALLIAGAQVDARRLLTALAAACTQADVDLRYGVAVDAIDGGTVHAAGARAEADIVVIASGAWTPALASLCGIDLAGEPVKGQMLRLDAADGVLGRFVHAHGAYLIPRRGRGIVVGATMVESGFDRAEDPTATARLAADARALAPVLAAAPVVETWTGLRPRLIGGLPLIARVRSDLIIATGHFRNGILLTPVTAAAVAALALDTPPPCDLAPFTGRRRSAQTVVGGGPRSTTGPTRP